MSQWPIETTAKRLGLSGSQQVIALTGKCRQTLCQWHKSQKQFFDIVLRGCAYPVAVDALEDICKDYRSLCAVDEVEPTNSEAYNKAMKMVDNHKGGE